MDNKVIEMSKAGKTQVYISKELGIGRKKIRRILRENDVPTQTEKELSCKFCKEKFKTVSRHAKYCSDTCRGKAHITTKRKCVSCGGVYDAYSTKELYYCKKCPAPEKDRRVQRMEKGCSYCGASYIGTLNGTDYCSEECRRLYYYYSVVKPSKPVIERECAECGILYTEGGYKYCSEQCGSKRVNRSKEVRRRKRMYKNGYVDESITLDKLIDRDNNICYLCGEECNKEDHEIKDGYFIVGNTYPSIDHVIPISKGGVHQYSNVKLAHMVCNSIKGSEAEG